MPKLTGGHKIKVEILLLDPSLISSGLCAFIADLLDYCISPVTSTFYICYFILKKDSGDTLQNTSFWGFVLFRYLTSPGKKYKE